MSMCLDVYSVPEDQISQLMQTPDYFTQVTAYESTICQRISLEKSWHGVFYLLSGSAWEPKGPVGLIATGGSLVPESDGGYGEARLLSPAESAAFSEAIEPIDDTQFWARFDPDAMSAEGIYPEIWDEPEADLREEYVFYFNSLKVFVAEAVAGGHGLMVVLG